MFHVSPIPCLISMPFLGEARWRVESLPARTMVGRWRESRGVVVMAVDVEDLKQQLREAPECSAPLVNAHSLRTTKEAPAKNNKISDFKDSYKLAKNSFVLPGLGESDDKCMTLRATAFSEDGSAIKYEHYKCKRVECPKCWTDWARRRVFDIAMRIESFARWSPPEDWLSRLGCPDKLLASKERCLRSGNERPFFAVCSVPPSEAKTWNWERLNESLFRRGYRRFGGVGIDGGYSLFHPFRLKVRAKKELQDAGWGSGGMDAGYWKGVREDALNWDSWRSYCKFGPHLHSIVFGDPEAHSSKDYIIRFKGSGKPEPMSLERVIGYLFYVITHTGVGSNFHSRATRSFGVLYNLNPQELLPDSEFQELANEIAERINMVWDGEELVYDTDSEGEDEDQSYNWISIFRLEDYMNNEEWVNSLPQNSYEFLDWLLDYFKKGCGYIPPPEEDEELRESVKFWNITEVSEVLPEESIEEEAKAIGVS